jgi:cysteine desulfurase/selenocysteine lyase
MNKEILESAREDFPVLKRLRNGKPPIYFDNACTTLVPKQVVDEITEYYTQHPGCGEKRSRYWFAKDVTRRIEGDHSGGVEGSRQKIRDFIGAESEREIIFTSNATHAINMVALGFKFQPGDQVLLTDMEHNSNLIPWLRLQKRNVPIEVNYVESKPDHSFNFEDLKGKLEKGRVRLVSMGYTSNLTGYTIPAKDIIGLAHQYGASVLLDAAQTVPHRAVDVQDLDVDFLAFSIHKMCGPRGVGVLYAKQELLGKKPHEEDETELLQPYIAGGGTISDTTYDSYNLLEPPERFEAGVQNYSGQIAAGAAVKYLQQIGMDDISAHEHRLNSYLTEQLLDRYGDREWFRILGPRDAVQRGGILTFEVKRPNCMGITEELDERSNVMIRDGAFCVHSYLNKEFGQGWTRPRLQGEHRMLYRISLYFYNTMNECQTFLETLDKIFEERGYTQN